MILIFGANGYIGKAITKKLSYTSPQVIKYNDNKESRKICYPRIIIYLAKKNKKKYQFGNIKKLLNYYIVRNKNLKLIYLSSASVYGDSSVANAIHRNTKTNPMTSYGAGKLSEEKDIIKFSQSNRNFKYTIIRSPTIYSNYEDNQHKLLNFLLRNNVPLPFKISENRRSFIYLENLLSFVLHIIKRDLFINSFFLIGEKRNLSTESFISQIKKKYNSSSYVFSFNKHIFQLILKIINRENIFKKLFGSFQINATITFFKTNWRPKQTK
jgi:nucleoside-diphosphate-sugar epimerase